MKRKLLVLGLTIGAVLTCTGCNKQIFDTTYSYEKAIIYLPDGEIIEGKVDSWTDYEDGDQLQIEMNGETYLVHSSNCVLISE